MNFLSINHIVQSARAVVARFPLAILNGIVGTLAALTLVQFDDLIKHSEPYLNLVMTTTLGLLLFTAIELFLERVNPVKGKQMALKALGLAFLVAYYLLLPTDFDYESAEFVIRFVLLGIAFLLSVTFAPFIMNRSEANGFWQHNKTLFIRLFFTFVYNLVLFLGLCLALVSMDKLLGVNVADETYGKLAIFILGFVAIPFFLAGVPEKLSALEKATDYPKGIRLFAQYILMPLLLIYAVILYIYTGKIVALWDWPEGMVSYLIITFAIGGMLTYLLFFPMMGKVAAAKKAAPKTDAAPPAWLKIFSRGIYILILPMTVVFFLAIKIRIDTYGLTEMRYYGLVLCAWFVAMSLYFLFSSKRNIMVMSASLFFIVLASSFGPWGAISVAEDSQMARLKDALIRNQLLIEDHAQKVGEQQISEKDITTISSTLDYLYRFHGFESIQPWFKEELPLVARNEICYEVSCCYGGQCIMEILGISYINEWDRRQANEDYDGPFYYSIEGNQVVPVGGYGYMLKFYVYETAGQDFKIEGESYNLSLRGSTLFLQGPGTPKVVDINPLLTKMEAGAPKAAIQYLPSAEQDGLKVLINSVGFTGKEEANRKFQHVEGYLLLP